MAEHIQGLTPTLAEDVATVRAWEIDEGAKYPNEEMARILAAVTPVTEVGAENFWPAHEDNRPPE